VTTVNRENQLNRAVFRSPDEWKTALMTLPDNSYVEVMRSIFGNIKTPFNKHRLMEELASFLSRREIQEAITAYIDGRDHRIIAAIAILHEPAPGDLESFFAGEYSYVDLHGILLNLEERLIVYRFREDDIFHLALNPLLEPVLAPFVADKGVLFPTAAADGEGETAPAYAGHPPDDRIMAALIAFVFGEPEFFRAEGEIRRKVLDESRALFPGLPVESLIGGFQALGLFSVQGERLLPDVQKLNFFAALSFQGRLEYWAAGICLYEQGSGFFIRYLHRGRLQSLARFIHSFTACLETGRRYPRTTLKRLADMVRRVVFAGSLAGPVVGEPAEMAAEQNAPVGFDQILGALEKTGLLVSPVPGFWSPVSAVTQAAETGRSVETGQPAETGRPVIAMDTAFSCILYPEIGFADALAIASFSLVRETGTAVRFELTRDSVVRGFNRGIKAEAILDMLNRLSGDRTDQNLRWTVTDWEKRYAEVSLYQGLILTLSEDSRYLAETKPVASLIRRTLAPGVYLLSGSERDEAIQGLRRAGIDIIAQPAADQYAEDGQSSPWLSPYPAPPAMTRMGDLSPEDLRELFLKQGEAQSQAKSVGVPPAQQERFRSLLEKMQIPQQERNELAARIERRLILTESQLAGASVRFEKLEARNLDYAGKIVVVKQAIASKSLLEIGWSSADGGTNRAMGIPSSLEKFEGETTLVLKPIHQEAVEPLRLSLGKISLVRRIKQSIFGE
jgi:hypothetical protein